ncbi:MAG: PilZ domain-containing protein [Candidatus Omnitrophota bacterium]|nr:PilZ domain-containing protein [Candidatus Omnitrophota bacterium]
MKMRDRLIERRKYIRLKTPVSVTYAVPDTGVVHTSVAKDMSADGLRLETKARGIAEGAVLELKMELCGAHSPVHAKGKVVWIKQLSLEDDAPYDMGIEFIEIEEDNKNTFLKFLCDLIYNLPKENENVSF